MIPNQRQHYWGVLCLCSKVHPVKLAKPDQGEQPPTVREFLIMCPSRLEDIRFTLAEVFKYVGPLDDNFRPHQLFLEPRTPQGHG